jgi:hypothetical protein
MKQTTQSSLFDPAPPEPPRMPPEPPVAPARHIAPASASEAERDRQSWSASLELFFSRGLSVISG